MISKQQDNLFTNTSGKTPDRTLTSGSSNRNFFFFFWSKGRSRSFPISSSRRAFGSIAVSFSSSSSLLLRNPQLPTNINVQTNTDAVQELCLSTTAKLKKQKSIYPIRHGSYMPSYRFPGGSKLPSLARACSLFPLHKTARNESEREKEQMQRPNSRRTWTTKTLTLITGLALLRVDY